jgi:hypothetical protein
VDSVFALINNLRRSVCQTSPSWTPHSSLGEFRSMSRASRSLCLKLYTGRDKSPLWRERLCASLEI